MQLQDFAKPGNELFLFLDAKIHQHIAYRRPNVNALIMSKDYIMEGHALIQACGCSFEHWYINNDWLVRKLHFFCEQIFLAVLLICYLWGDEDPNN